MKFLTTILCAYILSVSAAPCSFDSGASGCNCPTEQQASGADAHSGCSGMCSPFCSCGACGSFSIILPVDSYPLQQDFSENYYSFPPTIHFLTLPKKIWQPPKL